MQTAGSRFMENHGFLVEGDRFEPEEASRYLLQGWLVPETTLKFYWGNRELPADVQIPDGQVSEKYHGMECLAAVQLPEERPWKKNLKIYACTGQKKKLCFLISGKELEEKQKGTVSGEEALTGWKKQKAVWKKAVRYLQYHGVLAFLKKGARKLLSPGRRPVVYSRWLRKHLPGKKELKEQQKHRFPFAPKLSVVAAEGREETGLLELKKSLEAQTYRNWELCAGKSLSEALKQASGEYFVFAAAGDLFTPNALYEIVKAVNENPKISFLYTDEDCLGAGRKPEDPAMKPDFNLDLLCSRNYIGHLFAVKREVAQQTETNRNICPEAEEYDLIFQCVEKSEEIFHIPKVLYHGQKKEIPAEGWPEEPASEYQAEKCAVEAHYRRQGIPAEVIWGECPGVYRTRFLYTGTPLVSVLIPNKDHIRELDRCIRSIEEKTTYPNYEYIIIENNSQCRETFDYYEKLQQENPKVQVVYWEGEFNYSAINNFGAGFAKGEYLLLLNNDVEVINPDWMEELLSYCRRPDVGAAGARLYYPNDTIQHAGVAVGIGGIAGHCFTGQKRGCPGVGNRIVCAQDYSAVTAACMMVKKSVFEETGGLTEELKVAFNDVDFCLKVRRAGYLVVYNPYAQLYHYESESRGLEDTPEKVARFQREIRLFEKRWPEILRDGDPCYSPNLTLEAQDFSLRRMEREN